jgi:hypothetical protein
MAGIGDIDGDGITDYLIGSSDMGTNGVRSGRVDCYSGASGALLFTLLGNGYEEFGESCIGLGDVNGDGVADFAIGGPFADGIAPHAGIVRVYSGRSLRLRADVCDVSQRLGGAQTLSVDLGQGVGGAPYAILGSMSGLNPGMLLGGVHVPLNMDPYTVLTWTSANGLVFQNTVGALDASGRAQAVIRVPTSPNLSGLTVVHCCLWFDQAFAPRGATGTVPLRIRD